MAAKFKGRDKVMWGTTTSAGSALLKQASPPWRPHSRIQYFFSGGLDLDPSPFFISSVRPGVSGHVFKVLQGPRDFEESRPFQYESYSYCNRPYRQFLQAPAWLGEGGAVSWSPVIPRHSILPHSAPPLHTPNYVIPFYIAPIYAIPTLNSLLSIMVLTFHFFSVPYYLTYMRLSRPFVAHFTIKHYHYTKDMPI